MINNVWKTRHWILRRSCRAQMKKTAVRSPECSSIQCWRFLWARHHLFDFLTFDRYFRYSCALKYCATHVGPEKKSRLLQFSFFTIVYTSHRVMIIWVGAPGQQIESGHMHTQINVCHGLLPGPICFYIQAQFLLFTTASRRFNNTMKLKKQQEQLAILLKNSTAIK